MTKCLQCVSRITKLYDQVSQYYSGNNSHTGKTTIFEMQHISSKTNGNNATNRNGLAGRHTVSQHQNTSPIDEGIANKVSQS